MLNDGVGMDIVIDGGRSGVVRLTRIFLVEVLVLILPAKAPAITPLL